MNKQNDGFLNEVAISLAALKQLDVGSEIVVLTNDNQVGWFSVDKIVTQRGCKGGTQLTLKEISSGNIAKLFVNNSLPEGVVRVRRVSAGVNSRTLRNVMKAPIVQPIEEKEKAVVKGPIVQPIEEFENILDVPLTEEEQETLSQAALELPVFMETETIPVETSETVKEAAEISVSQ